MTSDLLALLRLPAETRLAPSQFAPEPQALARWLEQLPKANLGQSTRSLFQAAGELNAVKLAPDARLTLLEQLRPAIYFVANGLRKHFLNQPLVLSPQAQQVTELSHLLFLRLVQGYGKVALDTEALRRGGEAAIAWALHHAVVDLGQNLLRDLQLYREPQPGTWRLIHALAAHARKTGVHQRMVTDLQGGNSDTNTAYKRLLLLGSARPHQLRQDELTRLYVSLNDWAMQARLGGPDEGLLLVDPDADRGPVYRQYLPGEPGPDWLALDTERLAEQLQASIDPTRETPIGALGNETLELLARAWQQAGERSFERRSAGGTVEVTLGLSATHSAVSGDVDFKLLLSPRGFQRLAPTGGNPFLKGAAAPSPVARKELRSRDIWDSPFDSAGQDDVKASVIDYQVQTHVEREQSASQEKFPRHRMDVVNVSAGGYCLTCGSAAAQIKTGEIIGIREPGHKSWQVGAVRWVRVSQSGPQLGVELLSPTAQAYGGRVLNKTGPPGEYLRVLVLPAIHHLGQPASIITPRLPFRAGQKINLAAHDEESKAQLEQRLRFTAAFNQFAFRHLEAAPPAPSGPGKKSDGFDNLWDTL